MILRIALEIVGDRGFVLSVGALSNMSGFCLICRVFVLSVGALYCLSGLCKVISCSGGPRPLGGRPRNRSSNNSTASSAAATAVPYVCRGGGFLFLCFLPMLGPFGILGWIRTGDGIHNAYVFVAISTFVRHFWCFGLKLLFYGNSFLFLTLRLGLILAKPYYQNARIDRGVIFGFR